MDTIKLDFNGFYFSTLVEFDSANESPSVRTITERAVGQSGETGGTLMSAIFSNNGFLSTVRVSFVTEDPVSRQKKNGGAFPPNLPRGVYAYTDNVFGTVPGEDISFSLAWQYYIFRKGKLISGKSATSNERIIVAAENSVAATPLKPNDIIRWRLVAIGGLQTYVDEQFAKATPEKRASVMTKAMMDNLTTREVADLF